MSDDVCICGVPKGRRIEVYVACRRGQTDMLLPAHHTSSRLTCSWEKIQNEEQETCSFLVCFVLVVISALKMAK